MVLEAEERRTGGRAGELPGFLIIGAMKCGTSSLYGMLAQHPEVAPAAEKEVHYFDVQYRRGLAWYREQFPGRPGARMGGEASPYYLFHPHAARRAAETVPYARLIVMLRNPIDRAFSHYQHMVRDGLEPLSFEDALTAEANRVPPEHERMLRDEGYNSPAHRHHSYILRGLYHEQFSEWLEYFPAQQCFVIVAEEFYRRPQAVYSETLRFLGLSPFVAHGAPLNVGGYAAKLEAETRQVLREFYAPHNERLYRMLGRDLGWA